MLDDTPRPFGLVWFPDVCRLKCDGSLWEASHPGHAGFWGFYFRRIKKIWGPLWKRTGEIYSFPGGIEGSRKFDVVGWRNA